MVSNARLDLPEPDSPVITISALRGILRCRSLRLCSRAPETTISPCDLTASSVRARLAGAAAGPATSGRRLPASAGVDLFEDRLGVVEVEVLVQVARGLLARSPVERHVERDQPRPLDALPLSPRRLIAADAFEVDRRLPAPPPSGPAWWEPSAVVSGSAAAGSRAPAGGGATAGSSCAIVPVPAG